MFHTTESIARGLESYRAAMEKALNVAPMVDTVGGGSWSTLGLPIHVAAWGARDYSAATEVAVRHESLFDFGKPKIINDRAWLRRSSFFFVTAYAVFPFRFAEWQPARELLGEDGSRERLPQGVCESHEMRVRLDLLDRSWGFDGLTREKVRDACKVLPDGLLKEIMDRYREAEEHVAEWRAALKSIAACV